MNEISLGKIWGLIKEYSYEELSDSDYSVDANFEELGIDSMSIVSLAFDIDDILDIEIDDGDLASIKCINDLTSFLEKEGVTVNKGFSDD